MTDAMKVKEVAGEWKHIGSAGFGFFIDNVAHGEVVRVTEMTWWAYYHSRQCGVDCATADEAKALVEQANREYFARLAPSPAVLDPVTVEALKPFAEAADYFDDKNLSKDEAPWRDEHPATHSFTVGQLRAARRALIGQPRNEQG